MDLFASFLKIGKDVLVYLLNRHIQRSSMVHVPNQQMAFLVQVLEVYFGGSESVYKIY